MTGADEPGDGRQHGGGAAARTPVPSVERLATGLAVAGFGLLMLTQVDGGGGLGVLVTGFALACVGIAWPSALGTDLVVGSAPPEKAGSAAGMSETSGEFGIALGVVVLGSIGTAVYRNRLTIPDGGAGRRSGDGTRGDHRCHLRGRAAARRARWRAARQRA